MEVADPSPTDLALGRVAYEARYPERRRLADEWESLPDGTKLIWIDVARAVRAAASNKDNSNAE
jgi:hypothetical protein